MPASSKSCFRLKQFHLKQAHSPMKVGTDALLLGAWSESPSAREILDIGTGTGILALMMAQKHPQAQIQALETEPQAQGEARENFLASPWADRLHLRPESLQMYQPQHSFDLILSNPPWYPPHTVSPLASRAEARSTLSLHWTEILHFASLHLQPQGLLSLILPHFETQALQRTAALLGLSARALCHVSSAPGRPFQRLLSAWSLESAPTKVQTLAIRKGGQYSAEYAQLLSAFFPA